MKQWLVSSFVLAGLCSALPSHGQDTAKAAGDQAAVHAAPAQAIQSEAERRQALIADINSKWGAFVAETYKTDAAAWAGNLSGLLARADVDTLHKASLAKPSRR